MGRRSRFRQASFSLLFFVLIPGTVFAWQKIADGLEHKKPTPSINLLRVDLKKYRIDLLIASDSQVAALPAKSYREKSGALLVINGGFFDENLRPLGLLVRRGTIENPLRDSDWGIFQMKAGNPSIIHRKEWSPEKVVTAIQVGPRLVINGKPPRFKKEEVPDRRSALGITEDGRLLIALADEPIPIQKWADLLKKEAASALNLDGGGSSQISVKVEGFSLEIEGTTGVPNALAVFPLTIPRGDN